MESTQGGRGHLRVEYKSHSGELELDELSTESHYESLSGEMTGSGV